MIVTKGAADVTTYVMLVDSAAGTPETSYTITNLDLQYTRMREAPAAKVDATALAATNSAHSDNKAIEIDATSSPGLYRVDWPDAAFASGADKVILVVSGTGLAPSVLEIDLWTPDTQAALATPTNITAAAGIAVSSIGNNVITAASIASDAITDAKVAADVTIASVTGAVGSVTGNVGGNVTGTVAGVTPATAAQVAAVLTTQITESYRANAAAPTLAQFMSEVLAHLGEAAISGTTKTINKFDHSTVAATFTLDSATDPATITRAT